MDKKAIALMNRKGKWFLSLAVLSLVLAILSSTLFLVYATYDNRFLFEPLAMALGILLVWAALYFLLAFLSLRRNASFIAGTLAFPSQEGVFIVLSLAPLTLSKSLPVTEIMLDDGSTVYWNENLGACPLGLNKRYRLDIRNSFVVSATEDRQ